LSNQSTIIELPEPEQTLFLNITFAEKKKRVNLRVEQSDENITELKMESQIEFLCYFPSLVRLIKFELCDKNENNVLAVEYLNIDDISDYHDDFILPELGPCFIDFYTNPFHTRKKKTHLLNNDTIELSNLNIDRILFQNDKPTTNDFSPIEEAGKKI
jgi:hypothetical protein